MFNIFKFTVIDNIAATMMNVLVNIVYATSAVRTTAILSDSKSVFPDFSPRAFDQTLHMVKHYPIVLLQHYATTHTILARAV